MIVGVQLSNNGNRILAMKTETIFSGLARLRRSVAIAAVAAVLGAAVPAVAQYYAPSPPPPLRREIVPAPPGAGWVWRAGFWRWNGYRWVWVPGHYVRVPRPGLHWIPGHWVRRPRGWFWVAGHWGQPAPPRYRRPARPGRVRRRGCRGRRGLSIVAGYEELGTGCRAVREGAGLYRDRARARRVCQHRRHRRGAREKAAGPGFGRGCRRARRGRRHAARGGSPPHHQL